MQYTKISCRWVVLRSTHNTQTRNVLVTWNFRMLNLVVDTVTTGFSYS